MSKRVLYYQICIADGRLGRFDSYYMLQLNLLTDFIFNVSCHFICWGSVKRIQSLLFPVSNCYISLEELKIVQCESIFIYLCL